MPAIGPPLHLWTSLLLVCGMPTCAFAQAANETPTTTAATATLTATSPGPASSSTTTSGLAQSPTSTPTRRYSEAASTCPFRTINYITHTLPQQCAKTSWSAPDGTASTAVPVANSTNSIQDALSRTSVSTSDEEAVGDPNPKAENARPDSLSSEAASAFAAVNIETAVRGEDPEGELEIESPFDNANFLSFEEWKKRNLAQAGQSPDNIGQGRAAPTNQAGRRRPVNVNALDSLGDEGEIEIDFSGFGPPSEGGHLPSHTQADTQDRAASKPVDEDGKIAPSSWALSKDAGKTCKERFNYASFDCAATVLKANKQAKSSTSVLVENKDSYMLNECSASNKFLIVELCDDILVDTVVLANYEFFSSMFRHFRVSVSDRYPVKMERWRTLGTFEARNTRDIQPFLITEPQIWARYVRVEFLTQYGNEFYCPLSLLRVHGTTMMEQFRREEEEARGLDDEDGDLEAEGRDVVKPASDSGPLSPDQIPLRLISSEPNEPDSPSSGPAPKTTGQDLKDTKDETRDQKAGAALDIPNQYTTKTSRSSLPTHSMDHTNFVEHSGEISSTLSIDFAPSELNQSASDIVERVTQATIGKHVQATAQEHTASDSSSSVAQTEAHFDGTSKPPVASPSTTHVAGKAHTHHTAGSSPTQSTRASSPQPVPPVPSTQESFYKSIHKRLLYLEANSTLSLQYIEEQSRILRDAFMKVEKRQLAKTEKFLSHLNSTVMQELKSFQNMYDQLWQSTIIELESMKERQNIEIGEIGARISLMADELVWQKRMAVVQSTLLLLCLGLVLFVRSGTLSSPSDAAIVQQLGNKYNSFFESSPPRSLESPGLVRRRRTFRNMWRSDTSIGLSDPPSDGQLITSDAEMEASRVENEIELTPPTPDTPLIHPATPTTDDQAARVQVLETQSGPATPNGTRDSRPSWEEVDRAMDQLKAEEQSVHSPTSRKRSDERRTKRSPLRRAHSSFDGTVDDASSDTEEGDGHAP